MNAKDLRDRISNNLKILRKCSGMTGEQFAKFLGISRCHLYSLERGKAERIIIDSLCSLDKITNLGSFFEDDFSIKIDKE
jgi:transcriptional regulator with XRE-family HTH domain